MAAQQGLSVSSIIKAAIINYVRQNQTTNSVPAPETLRQIINEYDQQESTAQMIPESYIQYSWRCTQPIEPITGDIGIDFNATGPEVKDVIRISLDKTSVKNLVEIITEHYTFNMVNSQSPKDFEGSTRYPAPDHLPDLEQRIIAGCLIFQVRTVS